MYNQGIRQYQKTTVETTSPERLIVMLYEGAIRNLQSARAAMRDNDIPAKALGLKKAHAIISELRHSLDHEIGGAIADNLAALYTYMLDEINRVSVSSDSTPIDNILRTIAPLYESWKKIPAGTAQRARQAAGGPHPASSYDSSSNETSEGESSETQELCMMV